MSSDEEYLISQVISYMKTDVATAKSFMIFAKSVFPKSFPVLFQSYKMERMEENLEECALCLSDLVKQFPNEALLVRELRSLADALYAEDENFLKLIFEKLSEDVKYEVMLAVTRNSQTVEEHCKLMLLFLKRLPNARLLQHGKDIIETLLKVESGPGISVPINLFRKMLVFDALPLILKVSQFEYKLKPHIFPMLQKAVEFYVCCMFCPPTPQDDAIRKEVIPLSDDNPAEGWKPLLKLLETVALRYRWSYPELFVTKFDDLSLGTLLTLLKRKNKTLSGLTSEKHRSEESSGYEEAYFCLVVTFFYYLHQFGRLIHPDIFSSTLTGPFNFIMMEGISYPQEECDKTICNDYKRTTKGFVAVSKYAPPENAKVLLNAFSVVLECWVLLHRHQHLMKEFNFLGKNLKLETWPVFQEFYVCVLMHERAHREAIDHLGRIQDNCKDVAYKSKVALQIASCYQYLVEFEHSLKILFDIIMSLSPSSSTNSVKTLSKCPARYLYFMGYNNREILQYCISLLLKLYKTQDKIDESYKDMALGYQLILMQYDLEHEYETLNSCIETISKAKTFCFPKFFNYVINVEILEAVAYLSTTAGGSVNLEILASPTFQASKQRAVTRGINKGAKDDLKQAFVSQMARCHENLDTLFIEFIKEEHSFLLLPLLNSD